MRVRAQIGMVLNLDKCIGCHTCSVTCKNVWTSRDGVEYAWFNNVETKPGVGYPKDLGEPETLERRLGTDQVRQVAAETGRQVADPGQYLRQPRPARDRRLLRAVRFRLRPPEIRPRGEGVSHRAAALEDQRRTDGEDRARAELGRDPRRRVFEALAGLQLRGRAEGHLRGVRKHLHDVPATAVRALPQPRPAPPPAPPERSTSARRTASS